MADTPASDSLYRKLAAIMFTDVKGFSSKMGKDEIATMKMLTFHNSVVQDNVVKHNGNIIKTVGDAFLVSFESVVSAVQCAINIQEQFHSHNKEIQDEHNKIIIRIGVHLGDIIIKDNDVFGDGVNIAARVQSITTPGGVSVSEDVARQIQNKIDLPILRLGKGELKNIKMPVDIYRIVMPWEKKREDWQEQITFSLKQKRTRSLVAYSTLLIIVIGALFFWWNSHRQREGNKSIAVLPFKLISDSKEDEYLSDGIAEQLANDLKKIKGLRVVSKFSSFAFNNTNLSDSIVASQLGVRYLLEGTLQPAGTTLKIIVLLYDAKLHAQEILHNYDIQRDELFETQRLITEEVTDRIDVHNTRDEKPLLPSTKLAYLSYLRGSYYLDKNSQKKDLEIAIDNFSTALKADSLFVTARAALALAQSKNGDLVNADRNCSKVFQIDSLNANILAIRGSIEYNKGNIETAIAYFERSEQLDPNNASALTNLGMIYLFIKNQPAKALNIYKILRELDPLNADMNSNLGIAYMYVREYEAAKQAFKRATVLNPRIVDSWINLAYMSEKLAQYDSAITYSHAALKLNPQSFSAYQTITNSSIVRGKLEEAESTVISGLNLMPGNFQLFYMLGVLYARQGLGEKSREIFKQGLQLANYSRSKDSTISDQIIYSALFNARLGKSNNALSDLTNAIETDSTNEDVFITGAGVYSILKNKSKMLELFRRARSMNIEYDLDYIKTALDFENYRNDPDLQLAARQ